jgi:hypothetical protein
LSATPATAALLKIRFTIDGYSSASSANVLSLFLVVMP